MDDGMARIGLLKQNLAIEPDLHNFVGFILIVVKNLGGSVFGSTSAALELLKDLRQAGAGSGYPLPAELLLSGCTLSVRWDDRDEKVMATLDVPPGDELIEQIRQYLQQSTEISDPALLLQRNTEMTRFLNETRERTEREIESMQQALLKQQEELSATMQKAQTDSLTGLLNRRAYDAKIDQAYRRTLRLRGENLSLILFDLDYFKNINDEFGHQYGDEYLKKMASAMMAIIRQDVDFAFRCGGDEFAVLMFADKNVACSRALQLLGSMNNKVSIGIVSISAEQNCTTDLQDFIKRADDALYHAKRTGRGRVVLSKFMSADSVAWEEYLPEAETPC